MKKTNRQIEQFVKHANAWNQTHPQFSKFGHALRRVLGRTEAHRKKTEKSIRDAAVDNAAVTAEKVIITDAAGNFQYTAEGIKRRDDEQDKILSQEIEVDSYMARDVPKDLTFAQIEVFAGFVLPELPEDEDEIEEYLEQLMNARGSNVPARAEQSEEERAS